MHCGAIGIISRGRLRVDVVHAAVVLHEDRSAQGMEVVEDARFLQDAPGVVASVQQRRPHPRRARSRAPPRRSITPQ
eukprot:6946659-Lingulodinium_polyedra.AAC.1